MSTLRLRAFTLRNEPFYFTANDLPVIISEEHFILASQPETPILRLDRLVRAMDHLPLAEGDTVEVDGVRYTVTYYRGFTLRSADKCVISSHLIKDYTFIAYGDKCVRRLQFKYLQSTFQMHSLYGCKDGAAVIGPSKHPVPREHLQISAGFTHNKQKLFYGDTVANKPLYMWHGRPCIDTDEGIFDIANNTLIGGLTDET